MKTFNFIICLSLLVLLFSSCDNVLTEKMVFDAQVVPTTIDSIKKDTIFVKKGIPISFNFSGNAQFISYFSGEPGKEYFYYNTTIIPASQYDSCFLKFDVTPSVTTGTIDSKYVANTLSLTVSDNFPGLLGISSAPAFSNDSANIRNTKDYNWTDLTAQCDFPITIGTKKSVKLNAMSLLSKNICLKFGYKTTLNDTVQPKWTIANLKFVKYQKSKAAVEVLAASLGFKQIDLLNSISAYSISGAGVWSKSNPVSMFISSSMSRSGLNEDYLISTPILLNPLPTDLIPTGALVKNITVDVKSYTYSYSNIGVYYATFSATNANYMDTQHTQANFIIKVK
ncbi:MAG: DUF5017 domain-containing protein [Paludibacter sp.]